MSKENVETFQRANEAWLADDLDAWLSELDPEAEWHTALEEAVEGRGVTFQGHDSLREAWKEYRYKKFGTLMDRVQEVRDLGESVLVLGHLDVSGRTAGTQFSQEFGQLVTFRDGKILRTDDFLSHADTLEAAGLREQAMSQENVELLRKGVDAYNRRDIEAMLAVWHPEVEWYPFTAQVEGGEAYHGHEGLKQWFANVDATFEDVEASFEEVRDLGDTVLALGHMSGRFRSGVSLDTPVGWLIRYRDGLAVWGRTYQSHAEALEAAGLRE